MSALENIKARTEGHTEGPWEADHTDPGVWSQEHIVIGQYTANDGFDSQMWEDGTKADRELLAAAPKLLAALEAVEKLHRKMPVYATFAGDCEHGEDCDSVEIGGESMCPAETEGYTCDECAELSSEELPDYPCATIRAITEALA